MRDYGKFPQFGGKNSKEIREKGMKHYCLYVIY